MSQVVITEDCFKKKREKSFQEEKKIDISSAFTTWQEGDVTKTLFIEKIIALALTPIAIFWLLLFVFFSIGVSAGLFVFKTLEKIWP